MRRPPPPGSSWARFCTSAYLLCPYGRGEQVVKGQRSVVWRGLRLIGSYVATHPVPFAVSVTGAATYAAMTVASTVVLGRVTDRVLAPAFGAGVSTRVIVWGIVAILAVAIVRAGGIITRRYFAGMT